MTNKFVVFLGSGLGIRILHPFLLLLDRDDQPVGVSEVGKYENLRETANWKKTIRSSKAISEISENKSNKSKF